MPPISDINVIVNYLSSPKFFNPTNTNNYEPDDREEK